MNELAWIVDAARRAGRQGRPAVLATVVKVAGSTYRRPGARMLFTATDEPVGLVSGGCLEGDLAERAREVLVSGAPRTVIYDLRSPDDIVWGLGLGCAGEVRVLLERLSPEHPAQHLAFLGRCIARRRAGVVATVFEGTRTLANALGQRLLLDERCTAVATFGDAGLAEAALPDAERVLADRRSTIRRYEVSAGTAEVLVEYIPRVTRLLVVGAGSDALPLVRGARQLGWRVTVVDDRPGYAAPERFPEADAVELVRFDALDPASLPLDSNTPVVVMTHHFLHDLRALEFLLATDAPYLGLLGPRRRTEKLLAQLNERGIRPSAERLARLHGPAGVDIGADTPEEIALAILAEIRAVLSGRSGGFLRDRRAPLHEWPG